MALERVSEKTIKDLTGKLIDVDFGYGTIRKSKIKSVHKRKTVNGKMILTIVELKENYTKTIYEDDIVKFY